MPRLDKPRYYVYQLVDSRTDLPFYVGKGQNRRAWEHESAVRRGEPVCNPRKTTRIREILAAGASIGVQVLADYDSELDALIHEAELIEDNPTLTNMAGGVDVLGPYRPRKRREVVRTVRRRDKVFSLSELALKKWSKSCGSDDEKMARAIDEWMEQLFSTTVRVWDQRRRVEREIRMIKLKDNRKFVTGTAKWPKKQ